MYKTAVYTLVNGGIQGLTHQKNSKNHTKMILPSSHWLCVNVLLNNIIFLDDKNLVANFVVRAPRSRKGGWRTR